MQRRSLYGDPDPPGRGAQQAPPAYPPASFAATRGAAGPIQAGAEESLLDLEHVIGYTGRHRQGLDLHPTEERQVVIGLGANVVLQDVTDPGSQTFLKGHDADVSAVHRSAGRLLASGQVASPASPVHASPVLVWDAPTQRIIHRLAGVIGGVQCLRLSPDDAFLAAGGGDGSLHIWDVTTGESVFNRRMLPAEVVAVAASASGVAAAGAGLISFVAWAPIDFSGRRPRYLLTFPVGDRMHSAELVYDYRLMRYNTNVFAAAVPATGFARQYTCGAVDAAGAIVAAGTTAGEVVTFALNPEPIMKTSIPACGNGVHSLVTPPLPPALARGGGFAATGYAGAPTRASPGAPVPVWATIGTPSPVAPRPVVLYAGGGDGSLRCLVGRPPSPGYVGGLPPTDPAGGGPGAAGWGWAITGEARVSGRIMSLAMAASATWLLVGSALGHVYRVSFGCDLTAGVGAAAAAATGRGGGYGGAAPPPRPVAELLETSHTGAVVGTAFLPGVSDAVVTVGNDGSVRLWNLNTYDIVWVHYASPEAVPLAVWADHPVSAAGGLGAPPGAAGLPSATTTTLGGAGAGATTTRRGVINSYVGTELPSSGPGGAHTLRASTAPPGPETAGLPAQVYVGFSDGSLRAFDAFGPTPIDGRGAVEAWRAGAHKGPVTAIAGNRAVVVTGGQDGRVCVWSRKGRDLLLQFQDHSRPVVAVATDVASLETVYSIGSDRLLNTYNLRAERRVKVHVLPGGGGGGERYPGGAATAGLHAGGRADPTVPGAYLTPGALGGSPPAGSNMACLSQNVDPASERELFTGTSDGKIVCWDVDIPEVAIGVIDLAAHVPVVGASSGGGGGAPAGPGYAANPPRAPAGAGWGGPGASRAATASSLGTSLAPAGPSSAPTPSRSDATRINGVAVSPSGRELAVVTQDGGVHVLALGPSGTIATPLPAGARGMAFGIGGGAGGGGPSSRIAAVKWRASYRGTSPYLAVRWAPDGKQIVAVAADACVSVFNWFG